MYRSVLIADEDVNIGNMAISIPWNSTAAGFNMKTPTECINVKNYESAEAWQEALGNLDEIQAVFIICDLQEEEYDFLAKLHNVTQLYLYTAKNLSNMNFLKQMIYMKYLFINHSNISDITPIVELVKIQEQQRTLVSVENWSARWNLQLENIAITDGKISDLTPFEEVSTYFSDFNFSGNQIKVLPELKNVRIYYLGMEGNQIESIEEYMNVHGSYLIDVRNNQIKSVEFMSEGEYNVGRFYIGNNPCDVRILGKYNFIETDIDVDWEDEI